MSIVACTQKQPTKKEGSSGVDRSKSREYIREIAKVIKYSGAEVTHATASCPRTTAMDVCNNFHLPLHSFD